jgi:hypothetical protein
MVAMCRFLSWGFVAQWLRCADSSHEVLLLNDCDVQIPLMRFCCSMIAMCRFLSWGCVAQWLRCADSSHEVLLLNDCDVQIPLIRFYCSMIAMCRFLSWGFVTQWMRCADSSHEVLLLNDCVCTFLWQLYSLSLLELWFLINPLVSSNFSYISLTLFCQSGFRLCCLDASCFVNLDLDYVV